MALAAMRFVRFLLAAPALFTLCACGADGGTGPESAGSIAFAAAPDTLYSISDTVALDVVVQSVSGTALPDAPVTFSSSAENVARVIPGGRLVSYGIGTARITASSGSLQATRDVVVRQRLTAVRVTRAEVRLGVGRSTSFTAVPTDARANPIGGLPAPLFFSSDSTFLRVSATGAATGLRTGTGRVIARVASPADGQREGSAEVRVVTLAADPVVGMGAASFSPATVDIAAGGSVRFVNTSGAAHDVDFAGALEKIPAHTSGESTRTFPVAGTFPFHCNLHAGMVGTVHVSP